MYSWDFDEQALATMAEELVGGTSFPLQMMEYAGTVAYAQEVAFHLAATYEQRFDESFGEGAWRALSPEERGRVLAATALSISLQIWACWATISVFACGTSRLPKRRARS